MNPERLRQAPNVAIVGSSSPLGKELRELIRRMAGQNPAWGQERIANELLLKLGLQVSPRTVGTHLYQLFPKLGITSRAALRDALEALVERR